ncbi:glutathione S-transferase [Rhodovulum iodosum]|uniref:Glutathione S-transferase n=1 Tax=Rhodovulum iodosum TaxID=68291 RepID=A0ABV3XR41_9RHOB|nr:glutathione S-transferase [Rhodovulum robiginosum]RSK32791.1 glutathione S-transferase [Rhodovulum robiginosum]
MQLFDNPASPFCRKVKVVLRETGQEADVEPIPVAGHPTECSAMPLAHNPLGKIPSLIRPDGPALYDSRVICRFLDDRAGGRLYPSAPRLWEALTLEATADGMMDAAVLMIYETRSRPESKRSPDWVEAQWDKISRSLATLDGRWMAYLAGPVDIGQIALGCALGYLDFRHGTRDWRTGHDRLASWYADFVQRPSMVATTPA